MTEFKEWPKIHRLNRPIIVTEKLDGTNACVCIGEDGKLAHVQSRSRIITPSDDNYGFARYVHDNVGAFEALGPGYHYGEWWGNGIQRGYGLPKGDKRFSLFNVSRWNVDNVPNGICIVPILCTTDTFSYEEIRQAYETLRREGSVAAPGFDKPEGIVLFHTHANTCFKWTYENDQEGKGNR